MSLGIQELGKAVNWRLSLVKSVRMAIAGKADVLRRSYCI